MAMKISDELRRRYKKNASWRILFDLLAEYTNRISESAAETIKNRTDLPHKTVVDLLKDLAALGVGTFKNGRHGLQTRIIWHYSPSSVGGVASGRFDDLEEYRDDGSKESDDSLLESTKISSPNSQAQIVREARDDLARRLGLSPDRIAITITY